MLKSICQASVPRDAFPPTPPGPEGSNGNGLLRVQWVPGAWLIFPAENAGRVSPQLLYLRYPLRSAPKRQQYWFRMVPDPQTADFTLAAAIRRYFDVVLYLLIFTGFGTLASTGRLDIPTVVLVTGALLFRGYALVRRRRVRLSERWTNLLTVGCVAFFIADEFLISHEFLSATVHLILFVMLVRLFSAQRDR